MPEPFYVLLYQLLRTPPSRYCSFVYAQTAHTPEAIFFVDGFPDTVSRVSCIASEPLGVDAEVNVGKVSLTGV